MKIKQAMSEYDTALLLTLASIVCSKQDGSAAAPLDDKKLTLLKPAVCKILKKLDLVDPSIIPAPSDGVPWSQR